MKFLLVLVLLISSTLSFASDESPFDTDPFFTHRGASSDQEAILMAIVHGIKTANLFDCNWGNMMNTLSNFEAQYRVVEHLQAPDTTLDIHPEGRSPYVDIESVWAGGLRRMDSHVVLSADQSQVLRVDFAIATLRESTVNTGTILNPSYETRTTSTLEYKASCKVR